MIIFILLGSSFLIAGAIALAWDVIQAMDGGHFVLTPLGKTWFDLDASSLNFSQAIIQRYTFPEIWDPGIITILNWPTIFVLFGTGVILLLIAGILGMGRRTRR